MKKFLLLTLIMCLFGGLSSSLMAQFNLTYNQGAANQYTLTFTPTSDTECAVQMNKGNAPGANTDLVIPATVENNGKTYKVVSIPNNAFSGASSYINTASDYFTSLTIPNTVVSIGAYAFRYWSNCTTVILGEGITNISNNAFANSSSITTIYCYANTPPTCGGNAVFHTTVENNAKVYVPANSLNEYKKEATSGSGVGWAYININNFYAMSSTPALPDAPTLTSPTNGATGIFNPSLDFTLSNNTAQYEIFLAEAAGTGAGAYTTLTNLVDKTNNTVSYQTNNLKPNTTYYWYVVAENDKGEVSSAEYSFTTSNFGAPGIPTLVSPENNAPIAENPNLSWNFGEYTEQYQVLFGTDSDNLDVVQDWTSTLATSYQTNNLAVGDYFWKIVVKNYVGETSSEVFKFTKLGAPDNVTPISPADGATEVSSKTIRFTFAPNTTHYRFLYGESAGTLAYCGHGTATTWLETGGATEMEITAPYSETGTTYYWAVDVMNGYGQRTVHQGGDAIDVFHFTTSSIAAATNLTNTLNNREVTLSWSYGNGNTADEYQVLLGTEQNNLAVVQEWTSRGGLSEGSFIKDGLDAGTTYYWQVNVRKDGGNALSSEIASFTTDPLPGVPTLNYPSNNEEITSDPKLSWTFGKNTIEYQLLFGTDSDNLDVVQDWTSTLATSYQTNGLAIDDYFWKVVARNNIGETSSELFKFTKLGAPDNVTPISHTNGENITSKTIRFKFAEGTEEYRILYGEKADQLAYFGYGNENDWLETNNVTEFEFEAPYFSPGQTYYWAVDVKNSNGYRSIWNDGDIVDIFSFTAGVLPVENLYPENGTVCNSNPNLEWNYKDGSVQYQVLLGTSENSLDTVSDWSSQLLTIYQTSFNNKETYYWQVNVKDKNGNITEGEIWSFTTLFAPQNVQANPEQIFPTANGGSTTISWDIVEKASSYNVYLNGTLYTSTESNEIEITGLGYSMTGHNITVEAVYSDASVVMSNTIVVKVTGKGSIEATVKGSDNNPIEGAIVTLTCTKDEFGNADNVTQHIFETDADGNISGNISNGSYSVNITKPLYSDYNSTEDIIIENASTTRLNITLEQRLPDNVTPISPENEEENITSTTIRWQFDNNTSEYRFLFGESEENLQYWNGKNYNNTDWISTNSSEGEIELPEFTMSEHTYYWAVEVKNKVGERLYYDGNNVSGNVNAYSFETNSVLPAVYTSPSNGAIGLSDSTLTWNYVGDARQYRVYLGTDQNSLTAQIEWTNREEEATGFVRTGTYQTENLNNATTYYWRVDVKDANDNVYQGKTWSFATPLTVPTNLVAENDSIYPTVATNYVTGNTTISWTGPAGATAYNVYIDENAPSTTTDTSYVVSLERDLNGHSIQVSAIYEGLGESEKSDACIIKVIGYTNVNGTIKDEEGTLLEGATVTFTGKDAFKAEQSLSFATDASGKYNGYVPEGNYIMTVSSDDYLDYTEEDITIVYDATRTKDVTLYSRHIFSVNIDLNAISFNNIDIYLYNTNWDNNADYSGTYFVYYQKDNGDVIKDSNESYFNKYSTLNSTLLLSKNENFRKTWEGLPNGLYKIGVASDADKKIYWSETIVERRYFVLTNDGNWEEKASWSNGEIPLSTDNVFVNAKATINSDITVQNVVIVKNEDNVYNNSLTIENGGKLTATDVINESAITSFIINDGGQLHRTGNNLKELNGKFVMNITNPTEWSDKNKTGWQLISVPFSADANISEFTDVDDRYDFYKFDGNNQYKEWINFKDTTNVDLETSFKQGRGYLVSYRELKTFAPTGVFNPSSSHDFDITTGDKRMSGFQLLGNPFSFDMEWNKVEHSDLVDGFAVVNESGTYNYYDGSNGTIPVGDGFFVKAIGENPTMHYDANSRSRSEQIESINVIASSNKGNDNVIISFAGADKEGFPKLDNFNDKVANIFVNNNDIRYGIFNYDRNTTEVKLSFLASVMGRYTISMKANGEFDNLVLVDRFTGIETNMLLEDYSFTASGQQDHNRFVVRLSMNNNDVQEERFVYQSGNELIINGEGLVQIIDIMGRIVYTNDIQGESRIDANNFYSATYVVRVVNENEVKTQKIVIY